MSAPAERIMAYLVSRSAPVSLAQVCAGALVGGTAARGYLGQLEAAGRLRVTRPGAALQYQLIPASAVTRPVEVDGNDLDVLLGHFYDEVTGTPDRSHWRLPLLRQACDRLAAATRPPGAETHPVIRREPS